MTVTSYPFSQYQTLGPHLVSGESLNKYFGAPTVNRQTGIVATASGTQATAYQLTGTFNRVVTVATAADAVALPNSLNNHIIAIQNDGANSMQVFGNNTEAATINDVATGTGIAQAAGSLAIYICTEPGKWFTDTAENANFGAITATTITASGLITATGGLVQAPINAGATLALTSASFGKTINLNTAAGSVVTLPISTGSGGKFFFDVTTTITSNSHKILAGQATDYLQGMIILQKTATCSGFQGLISSTYCSLQMPAASSTPQGGNQGDSFIFTDVAANTWQVTGQGTAAGTVATPFSTATT